LAPVKDGPILLLMKYRLALLLIGLLPVPAMAEPLAAFYTASWAGLPAAGIRLSLDDGDHGWAGSVGIESRGLPRLLTRFRTDATAAGTVAPDGTALFERFDARYDLRKRHDRLIRIGYEDRDGDRFAERQPGDTSTKPQLAESFRRGVLDPVSALAAIRRRLLAGPPESGLTFTEPVYDGARRFDVVGRVSNVGGKEDVVSVDLTFKPIAGFKGETSEDGDPDDAPRPAEVTFSHDGRLLPLSLRVRVAWFPLVVRFQHLCRNYESCADTSP
jgi:hypothetical protein